MNDMSTWIVFFKDEEEVYAILKNKITEVW